LLYVAVFAAMAPRLSERGGLSGWLSRLGGALGGRAGYRHIFLGVTVYLVSIFVAAWAMALCCA
jgi:hypothetical protein